LLKSFDRCEPVLSLSKVEWREYYGAGILEGLKFNWSDGKESRAFGESPRHPLEKSVSFGED